MSQAEKIRVAVLYGGRSGEHEVSLVSAANVMQNLDRARFDVVPIGIDRQGRWFLGDDIFKKNLSTAPVALKLQCDAERMLFNPELIGKSLQAIQMFKPSQPTERLFDVIFPVVHGRLCEDGTVQGLLELADVPYVGCGVLSSAIGMDKDVSKRLVRDAGIAVPPFLTIKKDEWEQSPVAFCERVLNQLKLPLFVKPANTGSSVGVNKIKQADALMAAIHYAFLYDTKVIVEQGIDGIEIEVAVLQSLTRGEGPLVSVVGEIRPAAAHGFYSYASKYEDENGAELIIPAPITESLHDQVRHTAKEIFKLLECEGMCRVDLFLERGSNTIYFNEINSIPGFTAISMYPKLMAASGVDYADLLTRLVMLAIDRHTTKSKLRHEYVAMK